MSAIQNGNFRRSVLLLCASLLGAGCSNGEPAAAPKIEPLTLQVRTTAQSNEGRSLRMLVRVVEPKKFAKESYADLVKLAEKPDESVLADQLLRPRSTIQMRLPLETGSSVGVYFFFSNPAGDGWKVLIPESSGEETIEARKSGAYLQ